MTWRGLSRIGTQPLTTGEPWRVKLGFGGQMENITGGLFAMYRCAMKLESSSDGMEPLFIMALSEDITQRKRAEEALGRSEGYLAEAQKLTHTGSWALQVPQMENVYWSNEMYRIFGLDPDPTPPSFMEVARRLHPEDVPYRTRVFEQA